MTPLEILLKSNYYKSCDQLPEWMCSKESYCEQIRSLRTLLGMTQEQLANRAVQHPRLIRRLETQGETDPQLSTLIKTAEGLECDLVVRFVPKKPIPAVLEECARQKASKMIQLSKGSSAMEEQEPNDVFVQFQINELTKELLKKPSLIWEE